MKRKNTIKGPATVTRSKDPNCVNNLLSNYIYAFFLVFIGFNEYRILFYILLEIFFTLIASMFIFLYLIQLICFYVL